MEQRGQSQAHPGFVLQQRKHPASLPLCFALGACAASMTGVLLACWVTLSLFSLTPGTTVRPMAEAAASMLAAATGTGLGLALTAGCFVFGYDRKLMLGLGVAVAIVSLLPLPISQLFWHWVMQTHGLTPAP